MRCFFAIPLPEEAKTRLQEARKALSGLIDGAPIKWVELENLHLTLKFLGEISETDCKALVQNLSAKLQVADFPFQGFPIEFSGLGAFPNLKNPKVLWIGVQQRDNRLNNLHKVVEAAASETGLPKDLRKYAPHLTLGRIKQEGCVEISHGFLKGQEDIFNIGTITVKQFKLYESRLMPRGPVYKTLEIFPLIP